MKYLDIKGFRTGGPAFDQQKITITHKDAYIAGVSMDGNIVYSLAVAFIDPLTTKEVELFRKAVVNKFGFDNETVIRRPADESLPATGQSFIYEISNDMSINIDINAVDENDLSKFRVTASFYDDGLYEELKRNKKEEILNDI